MTSLWSWYVNVSTASSSCNIDNCSVSVLSFMTLSPYELTVQRLNCIAPIIESSTSDVTSARIVASGPVTFRRPIRNSIQCKHVTIIIFVYTTIRSIVFALMGLVHAGNWNEPIRIFCKNYSALLYVDVARIYGKEKTPWNAQTCYIYVCKETDYRVIIMMRIMMKWWEEWGGWRGWWWER